MWTYYRQTLVNGVALLFREDEERHQEVFRFKQGWAPSNELFVRRSAGDIDETDRVSEAEAFDVIRARGDDPAAVAPPLSA